MMGRRSLGWRLVPWLGLAMIAALPALARSEDNAHLERRIKAAFLYKFGGYVEWPSSSFPSRETPLTIAVVGDDLLAAELSRMVAGRTIERRSVSVSRVGPDESVEGAHIVFLGADAHGRLATISRRLRSKPVLLVTDWPGALSAGSMINFLISGGRVRFEISLPAAEDNGLTFRSGLLAVAQTVVPRTP